MYNCNQYTILRLYPLPYLCQTKDYLGINMNRIMCHDGTSHILLVVTLIARLQESNVKWHIFC